MRVFPLCLHRVSSVPFFWLTVIYVGRCRGEIKSLQLFSASIASRLVDFSMSSRIWTVYKLMRTRERPDPIPSKGGEPEDESTEVDGYNLATSLDIGLDGSGV